MLPIERLRAMVAGKKVAFIGAGVSHKQCIEQFAALGAQVTLCDQKPTLESFGEYAETLRRWRRTFIQEWPTIAASGFDETFRRKWEFYLAYCEAGFAADYIDVAQIRLERMEAA